MNSSLHNYCFTCRKDFAAERSLIQHLESPAHRPKTCCCPLCGEAYFRTWSQVAQHVEVGSCSRFSHSPAQLANFIRRWEVQNFGGNYFTRPLITDGQNESYIPQTRNMDTYWNGCAYECPVCRDTWSKAIWLQQHFPKHDQKLYICPKGNCSREFNRLNGLLAHMELGGCGLANEASKLMTQLRLTY